MDSAAFRPTSPGRLVTTVDGHDAYFPGELPPAIEFDSKLVARLAAASNAVGLLAGTGRNISNPALLIEPYLRREAVLSSRIEGTVSTLADLYEDEAIGSAPRQDVEEVRNYLRAHEYGLERLKTLPLSLRLLREVHKKLMEGVRGEGRHPGKFRSYQNWIARDPQAPIEDATYVPPPIVEMKLALANLEKFLHSDALPPLLIAGIAHYQFEATHPFGDGNGRVGRLLISLLLHQRGLLPQPLLYLSAYFERTRTEYYERLLRVSTDGDWSGWLLYFLNGVEIQANAAVEDAEWLLNLQARYHRLLVDAKARPSARELVDLLFVNPFTNARRAAATLHVADPTARAAISDLIEHEILTEVTGRKWGQSFLAVEILDAARGNTDTASNESGTPRVSRTTNAARSIRAARQA
jgi:Fic family protein